MPTTRRGRRPALAAAGALAASVTLLLGACGDAEGGATTSPGAPATGGSVTPSPDPSTTPSEQSPTPSGTDRATGATDLTIVLDDGSGSTRTWSLTCDPVGGTHPDPAAACQALDAHGATALPPGAQGPDVHPDLRRPGEGHGQGDLARQAGELRVLEDQRLRDQPLEVHGRAAAGHRRSQLGPGA